MGKRVGSIILAQIALLAAALAGAPVFAQSAPPRSSEDLVKVLEHYKPDASKSEQARAGADRQPPNTEDKSELAVFYRDRGRAAGRIGRISQQIEDLRRALEYAKTGAPQVDMPLLYAELSSAEARGGNILNAIRLRESQAASASTMGGQIVANALLASLNASMGDLPAAHAALKTADAAYNTVSNAGFRGNASLFRYSWTASLERARGTVAAAEGKRTEAEEAFRKALAAFEADKSFEGQRVRAMQGDRQLDAVARESVQRSHAQALMRLNRMAEAELVARDALKKALERVGRYSVDTGASVALLSSVLLQQARYQEAETFAREALDILVKIGVTPESQFMVISYDRLGTVHAMQRRWAEADAEFRNMRAGLEKDPLLLEKRGAGRTAWALAMVKLGQAKQAIGMLERMLERSRNRFGEGSYEAAEIRGFLGVARAAAGERDAAVRECTTAAPVLIQENATGGAEGSSVQRQWALTQILEGCMGLLLDYAQSGQRVQGVDPLAESFRLADVARGGRVQLALSASAARAAISDPQLAELARTEQDAEQRVAALNELLSNMLSAPAGQQVPRIMEELRKEITALRSERQRAKTQIEKQFPEYANLVRPQPPTLDQVRSSLREGEALISIYVGTERTSVWAVPKTGTPAVVAVALGEAEVTQRVAHIRKALDPNATTIDDIPKFEVAAAHALFMDLLKPVESAWGEAKSLLIVPHLALGQLPFALLPTGAAAADKETLPFEVYRQVPWLARRAAITQLPSVNTLITLRRAQPVQASRRAYVGFGDPFFSRAHATEAIAAITDDLGTRGRVRLRNTPKLANVSSADLAMLPRLPDTRVEVLDVAQAMNADLNQDVFLGERASLKSIKSASLGNRKVIHFATHGLVPGELDGLTQPALALTTPDIVGAEGGDGLLKLEDILALKLNADWVVLSACNTASADGSANAEAVSGLGRAFFFAGARALLVSNWPVDSASARKLMTELFRRQAADATLDRAQALRQAMLQLIDSGVQLDAKDQPLYSYAHPLFWAPFSLVGDGAGR